MRALRRMWHRLLGIAGLHRSERDLNEEFASHIQMLAEDLIRRGVPDEEAWRRARVKFGNVPSTMEQYRDQRSVPFIDATLQDLRYAWRLMRRNRGFSTVAIVSLAIGIGANTAIFSVVNAVVLQPLPYRDPGQLFAVREVRTDKDTAVFPVNPAHARAWAAECRSLADVAILSNSRAQIGAGNEAAAIARGARVTHNFFSMLGAEPMLGRTFRAEEEEPGLDRVVILSESLWRARFNADRSLLGRMVLIDGVDHQVIGVVAGSFWTAFGGGVSSSPANNQYQMFRPLVIPIDQRTRLMGNYNYAALTRLKPGVTPEAALAELNVVQSRFPAMTGAGGELGALLIPLQDIVTGRSLALWMLAAAVGAVLLIVCVNLANLLLSRVAARARETAVRSALGASRGRIFAHAFSESMLLSGFGGACGLLLASVIVEMLTSTPTVQLPRLHEVRIDASVMVFALLATLATTVIFGVLPAWRLAGQLPGDALRSSGRAVTDGRQGARLREMLIGVEVGLSTALLIVAVLLSISLNRLLNVDKGFDTEQVFTFDVDTAGPQYEDAEGRSRFFDRLLARLDAIPGIQAVGFTTQLPLEGNSWNDAIYRDASSERHSVENRYASPGFFDAMGVKVLKGRAFDDTDRARGVAVLSPKAASLLWPDDQDPVGREFMGEDDKPKLLVGIVADTRAVLQDISAPHAYYPYWQRPPGDVAMVIRSRADADALVAPVRNALHGEDPTLPIAPIEPAQGLVDGSVAQRRLQSRLVVLFAVSALLVASVGIYGVVAYAVTRRRNELSIRLALGASRAALMASIVRQGMTPVLAGVAAGIALGLLLGRTIRALLFGVHATDGQTMALVSLLLVSVGLAACLIPARRATIGTTLDVLRSE
ncbi:MAG: ABC transporter permease [Cyanobacteria bacterium]|nr:ABC transporter permease [Cyanobacteriota bacterium]